MGYRALNWAWDAQLPSTQKFVLVALADMADESNSCFPGQERLAEMIGGSVSTVRRAVTALEDVGAISRTMRRREDGSRTSDRYVLHINRSICTVESPVNQEGGHRSNSAEVTGQSDRVTPSRTTSRTPSILSDASIDESDVVFSVRLGVIWDLWPSPRRSTRKVVEKSLRAALKVASWDLIIRAAEEHVRVWSSWATSDLKYVPMLPTWLNQERWTGAVPEPRGGGRASTIDVGREADRLLAEREQLAIGGVR